MFQKVSPVAFDPYIASLLQKAPYRYRGRASVLSRAISQRDSTLQLPAWFGALSESERRAMICLPERDRPLDPFPFSAESSVLKRHLFFDQTSWLPDNLLERGDRMMMANSLEGRMPFMDVELADCIANYPQDQFVSLRQGKRLLREALGERLPPSVLDRRKIGFKVPVDDWFRGPLRSLLNDTLASQTAATGSIYKKGYIANILDEHQKQRRNHEKLIWTMLSLEIFLREYGMHA
jgi:asparagine synthase (glutamine-hydrolysing)